METSEQVELLKARINSLEETVNKDFWKLVQLNDKLSEAVKSQWITIWANFVFSIIIFVLGTLFAYKFSVEAKCYVQEMELESLVL